MIYARRVKSKNYKSSKSKREQLDGRPRISHSPACILLSVWAVQTKLAMMENIRSTQADKLLGLSLLRLLILR